MQRILLGRVNVDTGQLFLIDPGYLDYWKPGEYVPDQEPDNSYARVTTALFDNNGWAEVERGVGFMTPSDGSYEVYGFLNDHDELIKIEIILQGEPGGAEPAAAR